MPTRSDAIVAVETSFTSGQLTFDQAVNALIGLAGATGTSLSFHIEAGTAVEYLAVHNPQHTNPNGEGFTGGPNAAAQSLPALLDAAFPAGATPPPYGWGFLAGIIAGSGYTTARTTTKLGQLVGHDAAASQAAVQALAVASLNVAPVDARLGTAIAIASLQGSVPITAADLAWTVGSYALGGNLTVPGAVALLAEVAVMRGNPQLAANVLAGQGVPVGAGSAGFAQEATDLATNVKALIQSGAIGLNAALDAVSSGGTLFNDGIAGGPAGRAIKLLLPFAAADASLTGAIGQHVAALVDPNAGIFANPAYRQISVQPAIDLIKAAAAAGQLSATTEVSLFSAIGALSGYANPLHPVGDEVRGLINAAAISAADAIAAIQAAGLGLDATIKVLLGVGASGNYQLSGQQFVYVGIDTLKSAAGSALATIAAGSPSLTAAQIGADATAALPSVDLALLLDVLVQAGLATGNQASERLFGGALASVATSGIPSVASQLPSVGAAVTAIRNRLVTESIAGQTPQTADAFQLVVGIALALSDPAQQVALGHSLGLGLNAPIFQISLSNVTSSLPASTALMVLTGLAGSEGYAGPTSSAIATLLASDPTTLLTVFDGAVGDGASPLPAATAIQVLINAAAFSAPSVAGAISTEIAAIIQHTPTLIVAGDAVVALLTALEALTGHYSTPTIDTYRANVAQALGQAIAVLVQAGAITASDVGVAVSNTVASGLLGAGRGLQALANLEAAGIDAAGLFVGLDGLITGHQLTPAQVFSGLNALDVQGAPAALSAAIANEIRELIEAHLETMAGLGTAAQVEAGAVRLGALFGSNPGLAQFVLDSLANRIETGLLTSDQAGLFLVDAYGQGGATATAVLATIQSLATVVPQSHTGPDLLVSSVTLKIGGAVAAGYLSGPDALHLIAAIDALDHALAQDALAGLILFGRVTAAALDAEVAAGGVTAANALAAIQTALQNSVAADARAAAVGEIAALVVHDGSLASSGLVTLLAEAGNGVPSVRAAAYSGIDAVAALPPGFGRQAFDGLLPLLNATNILIAGDAKAGLVSLLSNARLATSDAIADVAALGLPTASALSLFVALSNAPASRADIYAYLEAHLGSPFIREDVIAALAADAASHMASSGAAAQEIGHLAFGGGLTPAQVVAAMSLGASGTLTSAKIAALAAEIGGFDGTAGTSAAYGAAVAQRSLPLTGLADVIADDASHLRPAKAIAFLAGVASTLGIGPTAPTLDGLFQAGAITPSDVTGAVASGAVTAATGLGLLGTISATSTSPTVAASVVLTLSDAITGGAAASTGSLAAADVVGAIEALHASLSGSQLFSVFERMLLAGSTRSRPTL